QQSFGFECGGVTAAGRTHPHEHSDGHQGEGGQRGEPVESAGLEHGRKPGRRRVCGHRPGLWITYLMMLTRSWSMVSLAVMTREDDWNPRWAMIMFVNCSARSTFEFS